MLTLLQCCYDGNNTLMGLAENCSLGWAPKFSEQKVSSKLLTLSYLHRSRQRNTFNTIIYVKITWVSKSNSFGSSKGHSKPHLQVPSLSRYSFSSSNDFSSTLLGLKVVFEIIIKVQYITFIAVLSKTNKMEQNSLFLLPHIDDELGCNYSSPSPRYNDMVF